MRFTVRVSVALENVLGGSSVRSSASNTAQRNRKNIAGESKVGQRKKKKKMESRAYLIRKKFEQIIA